MRPPSPPSAQSVQTKKKPPADLGDLAVVGPPHVEDGHACRKQPDEQHDDVSGSPFGEHERPVQEDHENDQRSV